MAAKIQALDTLDGLAEFTKLARDFGGGPGPDAGLRHLRSGRMHCTGCSREMTMAVSSLLYPPGKQDERGVRYYDRQSLAPGLFRHSCVHCPARWTALIYNGPNGAALAIFGESHGGLSTPNTPEAVLDEAYKAQAASANSAAVAMYRAALEHLLFEQGYKMRELGPKLKALKKDVNGGSGPAWAHRLNLSFLSVLNKLGNYSIHPNDGSVEGQQHFDSRFLASVKATFVELLDLVYEDPARRAARLSQLQAGLDETAPSTTA